MGEQWTTTSDLGLYERDSGASYALRTGSGLDLVDMWNDIAVGDIINLYVTSSVANTSGADITKPMVQWGAWQFVDDTTFLGEMIVVPTNVDLTLPNGTAANSSLMLPQRLKVTSISGSGSQKTVNVTQPVPSTDFSISGLNVSPSVNTFEEEDSDSYQFVWGPSGSDPANSPTALSSDTGVVSVDYVDTEELSLSYTGEGSATVTVSYVNASGTTVSKTYLFEIEAAPSFATDFDLDGYSSGDTIFLYSENDINVNWLPDGSDPETDLSVSTASSSIATASTDNYAVTITGVSIGQTTLTLSYQGVTKNYTIRVEGLPPVPATDFDISGYEQGDTISIDVNDTEWCSYDFTPDNGVPDMMTVTSSNTSVATITYEDDSGIEITGVSAGSSTLTVVMNSNGQTVTKTYTIQVASTVVYATDFTVESMPNGWSFGINSGIDWSLDYAFTPSGSTPYSTPQVTISDTTKVSLVSSSDSDFVVRGLVEDTMATATIAYEDENGTTITKVYNLYVQPTYATDFSLYKNRQAHTPVAEGATVTFTNGDSDFFGYDFTPDVRWVEPYDDLAVTASDPSVATISTSGLGFTVATVAPGTTTLTVVLTKSDNTTVTKNYTIVVVPPVSTGFDLDGYSAGDTISLQDAAATINVGFTPSGSVPTSFTATSSDTGIATVSYANGVVTINPVASGTATLTAVLNESVTKQYTIKVSIPVPTNKVLGYDAVGFFKEKIDANGNTLATSAPTSSTVGVLGQLYTDTTSMHTYQCTAISGDTYTWTQRW